MNWLAVWIALGLMDAVSTGEHIVNGRLGNAVAGAFLLIWSAAMIAYYQARSRKQ